MVLLFFLPWAHIVACLPGVHATEGGAWLARVGASVDVLQRHYYHRSTGLWDCVPLAADRAVNIPFTGTWWNCAVTLRAVLDVMALTGNHSLAHEVATAWDLTGMEEALHLRTAGLDDLEWWAVAWTRAVEVTGDRRYLRRATTYFAVVAAHWDENAQAGFTRRGP